jgi:hypothetical protein
VFSERLPSAFDGFTILHLTDLHADMSGGAMAEAARLVSGLRYDLCVLTGDYRGLTYGPFHDCLREMQRLREVLSGDIYGVLATMTVSRWCRIWSGWESGCCSMSMS